MIPRRCQCFIRPLLTFSASLLLLSLCSSLVSTSSPPPPLCWLLLSSPASQSPSPSLPCPSLALPPFVSLSLLQLSSQMGVGMLTLLCSALSPPLLRPLSGPTPLGSPPGSPLDLRSPLTLSSLAALYPPLSAVRVHRCTVPTLLLGRTSGAVLGRSLRAKEALAEELSRARRRRGPLAAPLSPDAAASAAVLAPVTRVIGPAAAIKGLYAAFNERDAEAAASFLAEDCVYEDLLLGPSTVCRGKRAFYNAIRFHPAFVSSQLFSKLPLADKLPKLELVVDSVAEGDSAVGVEWHVEIGSTPFPLGRGLTQALINPETGEIVRVVDIAEAPWRVVGILLLPLIAASSAVSEVLAAALAGANERRDQSDTGYALDVSEPPFADLQPLSAPSEPAPPSVSTE
eukprot:scaffold35657_cov30-Tisochrysis_lutea.AAC.1